MVEFAMHDVLVTSISQVMMKSNEKGIRIVNDSSEDVMQESLYGDNLRLQQILADLLLISVNFTPAGGHIGIMVRLTKDQLGESVQLANLEFRYWNIKSAYCKVSVLEVHW